MRGLIVGIVLAAALAFWATSFSTAPQQYVIQAEDDPVPCAVKQAPDGIQRINGVLVATCER